MVKEYVANGIPILRCIDGNVINAGSGAKPVPLNDDFLLPEIIET